MVLLSSVDLPKLGMYALCSVERSIRVFAKLILPIIFMTCEQTHHKQTAQKCSRGKVKHMGDAQKV